MSTATKTHDVSSATAPTTLRWQSWPLRQKLPWSILLPVGLLVIEWGIARLTDSHAMGVVAMLLLSTSLWRSWLPVSFELSKRGIVQRCLGRTSFIPWSTVGSFQVRHQGILLIRNHDTAAVDLIGSLYLPWGSHREQVLGFFDHLHGLSRNAGR